MREDISASIHTRDVVDVVVDVVWMSLPGEAGGGWGSTGSQQGVYKFVQTFSHLLLVVNRKWDRAGLVDTVIQTYSATQCLINKMINYTVNNKLVWWWRTEECKRSEERWPRTDKQSRSHQDKEPIKSAAWTAHARTHRHTLSLGWIITIVDVVLDPGTGILETSNRLESGTTGVWRLGFIHHHFSSLFHVDWKTESLQKKKNSVCVCMRVCVWVCACVLERERKRDETLTEMTSR